MQVCRIVDDEKTEVYRMVLGLRENSKWGIVGWLMIRKPQLGEGEKGEVVGQDFGSQAVSEGAIQAGETRLEMTFKFPHVRFQLLVGLLSFLSA